MSISRVKFQMFIKSHHSDGSRVTWEDLESITTDIIGEVGKDLDNLVISDISMICPNEDSACLTDFQRLDFYTSVVDISPISIMKLADYLTHHYDVDVRVCAN